MINLNYEYSFISLIKEIISMFLFPYFWLRMIYNADIIRQFVIQNSKDVEGIGTICSFSYFNFAEFKSNRDKKPNFMEINLNDRKFFNSAFYYKVIFLLKFFLLNFFY